MNPVEAIRLWRLWENFEALNKKKESIMIKIPQLTHLLVTLAGVIGVPALAQHWLTLPGHGAIYIVLVSVSVLLHTISPSIFGGPSDDAQALAAADAQSAAKTPAPGITIKAGVILLCLALVLALPATVRAQTTSGTPSTNVYGLGGSWNNGGSPAVAGNGFYAHLVAANTTSSTTTLTGTTSTSYPSYAFTGLDILPIAKKPFTASTNISAGVAQQVFAYNACNFFTVATAGITATGTNTGWNWTGGVLADCRIKKTHWGVAPAVRWLKSSVSNGSGYQLIPGAGVTYHF